MVLKTRANPQRERRIIRVLLRALVDSEVLARFLDSVVSMMTTLWAAGRKMNLKVAMWFGLAMFVSRKLNFAAAQTAA